MLKVIQEKRFAGCWILSLCREHFYSFPFDKNESNFLHIAIWPLKMALIKLVGKAFTVCIKSTKTVKGFFSLAFIIFTVVYQE